MDDVRALKQRVVDESTRVMDGALEALLMEKTRMRLRSNPVMRLWVMVDYMRDLSCYSADTRDNKRLRRIVDEASGADSQRDEELVAAQDFAQRLGWDGSLIRRRLPEPEICAERDDADPVFVPRNLREKRARVLRGHFFKS